MLIGAFYRLPRCVGCGCLRAGEEEVFVLVGVATRKDFTVGQPLVKIEEI